MEIKSLLADSSKRTAYIAVETIRKNPKQLKSFINLAFSNIPLFSMRAANVIEKCNALYPTLVESYIEQILEQLDLFKIEGVKRCFLKLLTHYSFKKNEKAQGILVNICFNWLNSTNESIAIRYYCMQILYSITLYIPELSQELTSTIELILEEDGNSLKIQGRKILHKLYKKTK